MSLYIVTILVLVGIGILNSVAIIQLRSVVKNTASDLKTEIRRNKDSFKVVAQNEADRSKREQE